MESSLIRPKQAINTRTEPQTPAEKAADQGKVMIWSGSAIALIGIAIYCVTMIIGDMNQEPPRFRTEGLLTIGAGLAVWILGALTYLNALIDTNPGDDPF